MSTRFPDAILQRRVVEFSYEGRTRSVEPHAVGYDSAGELVLHGWELAGNREGFRRFSVRSIRMLTVSEKRFAGPRPGYRPDTLPLHRIVCRLEPSKPAEDHAA